ncbi:MAG: hypothetical protein EOO77_03850 [Oxalobacteraceae bacterium]|nr:MAG: hypothetical protein EOO77_03850 [Oxalobacteraceae bacterium]
MKNAYLAHRTKAEDLWRQLWSIYFYETDHDDEAVIDELFAALSPSAGDAAPQEELSLDHEKAYFERGMFAAYAWILTKKRGEELSDAVVDRAWDRRDEGMGPTECLPKRGGKHSG